MKRVLVIEDNRDNLRLITYALKRDGYDVAAAETGLEGVELALKEKYFFVVIDINLPDIDGFEVTRRIRNSPADGSVPLIVITSHAMMGDRERILAAGCTGYFEKPIDPLTIVAQIHEVIGVKKCEPGS
ncbi:MAG: response regulator [Geobacteraceae bacterium]|nr:MAG: response regulator [Geobacteraceae bacterium]